MYLNFIRFPVNMGIYFKSNWVSSFCDWKRTAQCGKTRNSLSPKKISSNQLFNNSFNLVKPLLSRNFCQKCVRENFRNFHTVHSEVWKKRKFTLAWQKFRESNVLSKEVTKEFISRNIFLVREKLEKREIHCHSNCVLVKSI